MTAPKPLALTEEQVLSIAKALADPRRYEILKRLGDNHHQALDCGSVRDCVDISAATLSHHMKELEMAGLVKAERHGKFVSYLLRRDVLEAFFQRLKSDLA
jgi:ArsR family transcriptional regulator, arsenate/arsenite/antimonite-responsive transcriptional repressor